MTIQNSDFCNVIACSLVEFINILEEFTVSSFRTGVLPCRFTKQVSMKRTNVSCSLLKPNSLRLHSQILDGHLYVEQK